MASFDFDLFVIGAGSGGVRAARVAATAGAKVAVAEEFRIGGTCVVRGCVPKKLLVYGSEYAKAFEDAKGYGWTVEWARFDWAVLRENVAREVDRLSGIYLRNLNNAGVEVIHDRAELLGSNTVRLVKDGRSVTARRILVATGGRPWRPKDLKGVEHTITSDEAFGLAELPKHVVIAGGGYIAVEFASIFQGLGAEVCLVYRGETVLNGFDDDVRVHVHAGLKNAGISVVTGTVLQEVSVRANGRKMAALANGMRLETDLVMMAVGREPYTQGLGLEAAGVAMGPRGAIAVNAYSQTNIASIFAVGDVTDRVNLTPVAIREGQAFADTIFNDRPTAFDHRDIPSAVFTRPQVGVVGMTETEARRVLGRVDIYKTVFRPMKHILPDNQERMLMKLVVEAATQRVVGVHVAGPEAAEMVQLAAIAVQAGLTKPQWDATCALHPTAAEELVTMREKFAPLALRGA
ncbi:MAG: glutathione-disulfide reductase [Alphaproteobacteria bacterium]|nr:glutathione-disulfide reductase [Alphaproteobacteria bacterium]